MIKLARQNRVFLGFLMTLVLLGACASSDDRIMTDARRFSAITRVDPSFRPPSGAQLVWYSDIIVQDQGASVQATSAQVDIIKRSIEDQLMRKSYRFTENNDEADYMIAAALVMNNSVESQQINELVQIYPNLAGAFNDLDAGTLVVVITPPTDPRTALLLWRGAMQAYTVGEALPADVRLARLEAYSRRLMDAAPDAGDN